MKVDEVLIRVQRQFGDESGVQVNEADVLRWVNDAQKEVVMQLDNLLMTMVTIDSVANVQFYTLPDDLLDLQSIDYCPQNPGVVYPLAYMNQRAMDEYLPGWKNTINRGQPAVFTRGPIEKSFMVYPVPDSSVTDGFTLNYSRYAVEVTALGNNVDLPSYFDTYVTEYCLMKAYEMDEEWEAADRKAAYVQSTMDFNNAREASFAKQKYAVIQPSSEDYL